MHAADSRGNGRGEKLAITRDSGTGKVIVTWSGRGVLKQASNLQGRFKPVHKHASTYVIEPVEQGAVFLAQWDNTFSANIVGYVNLDLPPGLSLIANPLVFPTNTVSFWWPEAPDGAQVLKYLPGGGYEVSTYDALAAAWSNPDFDISIGQGFFFRNTSSQPLRQTFVGEVMQGYVTNTLPTGLTTKGALIPMAGSINSVQGIPGLPGDELRLFVNDGAGGGDYVISIFSGEQNAWVPDLSLGVGEGFWIQKQQTQDWVRYFSAN